MFENGKSCESSKNRVVPIRRKYHNIAFECLNFMIIYGATHYVQMCVYV